MPAHEVSFFDTWKFRDLLFLLALEDANKGNLGKASEVYNAHYFSIYTPKFEGINALLLNIGPSCAAYKKEPTHKQRVLTHTLLFCQRCDRNDII